MEIFRFVNTDYLYALLVIPAMTLIFVIVRINRRKALERFGQKTIMQELMPDVSNNRPVLKFIIWLTAMTVLIVALARPQFGSKLTVEKSRGVEVIIALDVSNSMLAEDIQPNRLERAKRAISRLIDRMSDDKIGLIIFAGDAYTQLPITTDYPSAKLFLDAVNTGFVPRQGTAIGAAIDLAAKSFSPQFEGNKAIIVITDGENHEDDAKGAAAAAAGQGITVHTIGMGLTQGAPIPVFNNGQKEYLKDKNGEVVVTKLDEGMLQQIAAAGNGVYTRANNAEVGLNNIFSEMEKMEKAEIETKTYSEYEDRFQWLVGFAMLMILFDFIILERKNKYLKNIKLFGQ